MSILEIKKFPDKALRQKAQPVDVITDSDRKLIRDMFNTMYFAKGVGLAAPQVGILKRIIVCNPTGEKSNELAIVNPKVTYRKGKRVKDCEGCLSIPDLTGEVRRASVIGVTGEDSDGKSLIFEARDLLARIIEHETDHLDGILFIDRIGLLKRKFLMRKYKKQIGIFCAGKTY
jgi:peptide deformylase